MVVTRALLRYLLVSRVLRVNVKAIGRVLTVVAKALLGCSGWLLGGR